MPNNILAIDQGTTGTTCLVVQLQPTTKILGRGYSELPQHFPQPGWVEHDLEEIWKSVGLAAQQALAQAGTRDIAGIGITNTPTIFIGKTRINGWTYYEVLQSVMEKQGLRPRETLAA